jgi:hypothetical protein
MKLSPRHLVLIGMVLGGLACLGLIVLIPAPTSSSAAVAPPAVHATDADSFLNSIGVNMHVDQGYDPNTYIEPLRYTGVRQVRDGERHVESHVMIHQKTGVHYTINGGGDLDGLLAAGRILAAAGGLLALEGPNEVNNFPITYGGKKGGGHDGTWVPVAQFQKDLYVAAKADPVLRHYSVFGPSETGAETDNVGLQFLVIPQGAGALFPADTHFADYLNVHNYVSGNGNSYGDNQAWSAADPVLNARWDGLYGNHGVTWYHFYQGYTKEALADVLRVTTETGWDTTENAGGERTQGTVLTNTYLAQFKRGWKYTFVYEMRDDEGGAAKQGLYRGNTPKLAAKYLHNMTAVLADNGSIKETGSLAYAIPGQPSTVHDLLLQKSNKKFELVVWDERAHGGDTVTIELGAPHQTVTIYDVTVGTVPVASLTNTSSVHLDLSDHAMVVELD